jgi:Na+-transporting NADH:ubiquinone oxidoreductase subunit F
VGSVFVLFWASVAFVFIGVGLAALILLCRYFFVPKGYCTLEVNGSEDLTKKVLLGQTLLNALKNEGIAIPSPCGGRASCKQCRVRIVHPVPEPLDTELGAFSQRQLRDGWRLSCQVRLLSDMQVEVSERYLKIETYQASVLSNENVASFIKELIVEIPLDRVFDYRAGSYMEILIPRYSTNTSEWKETIDHRYWGEWTRFDLWDQTIVYEPKEEVARAYSLGSYPEEKTTLLFNVRIAPPPLQKGVVSSEIPWGIGSSYLFSLKAHDRVLMRGPYGESFMKDSSQDLYFLIGGAGSSFGRSHILDLLKRKKSTRKIALWYGARSSKENIYEDLYRGLEKEFPNFSYHLVLSEPTDEDIAHGWPKNDPLKTAFLFKAFEEGALKQMSNPESALYYVCGPPMHNKSVMKLLDDYGVLKENIILDDFGS